MKTWLTRVVVTAALAVLIGGSGPGGKGAAQGLAPAIDQTNHDPKKFGPRDVTAIAICTGKPIIGFVRYTLQYEKDGTLHAFESSVRCWVEDDYFGSNIREHVLQDFALLGGPVVSWAVTIDLWSSGVLSPENHLKACANSGTGGLPVSVSCGTDDNRGVEVLLR